MTEQEKPKRPFAYRVLGVDGMVTVSAALMTADCPTLGEIHRVVKPYLDCAVEHVLVLHNGKAVDMFVDETGVIKGLPRNEQATEIYRRNWLTQHPGTDPETLPHIAGPAVLFEDVVWT